MSLPTIFDTCRPRADVLAGAIRDDEFMADLSRVVNGTASACWGAFRAPRFPADEALKLARVVGLDFDWDSVTRHRNGTLRHVSEECMLDTLHWAAKNAREQNTGAARSLIESAHPIGDPTPLAALEALLNVLPPGVPSADKKKLDANFAGAANDFEALERLRKLAFAETVPAPKIPEQLPLELPDATEDKEEM